MRWQQVPSPPDQPLGHTMPAAEPPRGSAIASLGRPRIFGRRPSRSYYIRRRKLVPFRRLDNINHAIGLDREWILQAELALRGRDRPCFLKLSASTSSRRDTSSASHCKGTTLTIGARRSSIAGVSS